MSARGTAIRERAGRTPERTLWEAVLAARAGRRHGRTTDDMARDRCLSLVVHLPPRGEARLARALDSNEDRNAFELGSLDHAVLMASGTEVLRLGDGYHVVAFSDAVVSAWSSQDESMISGIARRDPGDPPPTIEGLALASGDRWIGPGDERMPLKRPVPSPAVVDGMDFAENLVDAMGFAGRETYVTFGDGDPGSIQVQGVGGAVGAVLSAAGALLPPAWEWIANKDVERLRSSWVRMPLEKGVRWREPTSATLRSLGHRTRMEAGRRARAWLDAHGGAGIVFEGVTNDVA